jgi:hypothetical protein
MSTYPEDFARITDEAGCSRPEALHIAKELA